MGERLRRCATPRTSPSCHLFKWAYIARQRSTTERSSRSRPPCKSCGAAWQQPADKRKASTGEHASAAKSTCFCAKLPALVVI